MDTNDIEVLADYDIIIGCDEVGRGPIAGPVVGCAALIRDSKTIEQLKELGLTDSKKLSTKKRLKILDTLGIKLSELELDKSYKIKTDDYCFSFVLCENNHDVIDEINILQASLKAMQKASILVAKKQKVNSRIKVLVDGNKTFESKNDIDFVIKGDSKIIAIGLASVIAKEFRDEKMKSLDLKYPGYNLAKHAGYPTKEHKLAVQKLGPSPIHRKTFKGVKEYL